jgi:hypothetical protein
MSTPPIATKLSELPKPILIQLLCCVREQYQSYLSEMKTKPIVARACSYCYFSYHPEHNWHLAKGMWDICDRCYQDYIRGVTSREAVVYRDRRIEYEQKLKSLSQ